MSVKRHNKRHWSDHKRKVKRDFYEYCGVEIFSFDHQYTSTFHRGNYTFITDKAKNKSHRHLSCFEASTEGQAYTVQWKYNVQSTGQYRIDVLYENTTAKDYTGRYIINPTKANDKSELNKLEKQVSDTQKKITTAQKKLTALQTAITAAENNKKLTKKEKTNLINAKNKQIKTLKSQIKAFEKTITKLQDQETTTHIMDGIDILFDGEKNIMKRKTLYLDFTEEGEQTIRFEFPPNCYFIGAIVRKIMVFTADSVESQGTNLIVKDVNTTFSDMADPSEASFTIGYDNSFECELSRSGYYMDYMDEVNVYFSEDAQFGSVPVRKFGGYVSSFKPDEDLTTLEISCGDRLIDGESKYILDLLLILNGTQDAKDMEYYNPINFNSYGALLKYICDVFEVTLHSNISKNYLVQGEKYSKGFAIKYGKNKDVKKIPVSNGYVTVNKNMVTLRNKPSGAKKQSWTLYEASKKPVKLVSEDGLPILTFHMTYGLGATKTSSESTTTGTVDNSENSAGSQLFGKCGRSKDGTALMAIGQRSVGKGAKTYPYNNIYKTIFKNKCPHCGGKLVWDSGRKDTDCVHCSRYNHSKREWGNISETEITCSSCCADFCSVTGWDKDGKYSKRLTYIKKPVKSSKAEQNKLHRGEMYGLTTKSGDVLKPSQVLSAIAKTAKQYKYERGATGQTYAQMKKTGHGDCWGFSDLIAREFKKYGVAARIYDYPTGSADHHRSVVYLNENNKWVSFPYKQYNVYPNQLGATSNLKINKNYHTYYKGNPINKATSKGSATSTSTTKVTTIKGYDKDKPIQGYFKITYSTEGKQSSKTSSIYLNFTTKAGTNSDLSGLTTVWVNNTTRQTSVDMSGYFADNEPNKTIYLHKIEFITAKIKSTEDKTNTNHYEFNKSTKDYASCKMDLYQIIFDNKPALNPTDLQSCGKSVTELLKEIVDDSGYLAYMNYNTHRCDDNIFFRIDNQTVPVYTATEGDESNILEFTSINYTPVSNLRNKSICVFKTSSEKYAFVDTGDINSILNYGEKTTLNTVSDQIGSKQAYFEARNSKDYQPEEIYSYTIVVPYAPNIHVGDLIEVISDNKNLNDIKTVKSVKHTYDPSDIPKTRTEIGCDELAPLLRIKKAQENLRKSTRAKSTWFSHTANPIEDEELYVWER